MLLPGLGIRLGERPRFAERAAALGGESHHPRRRRALSYEIPLLGGEICLVGHLVSPFALPPSSMTTSSTRSSPSGRWVISSTDRSPDAARMSSRRRSAVG